MQQVFCRKNGEIRRRVEVDGNAHETVIQDVADELLPAESAWWQSVLRGQRPSGRGAGKPIRIVDAFCGSGGFALGVEAAVAAMGRTAQFAAIVDTDAAALAVHKHNLGARRALTTSAASLVDFHVLGLGDAATFGYEPEVVHPDLADVGSVDVFIAGPPCQGHSNLNNHTRRADARNDLYVTAVALGVALGSDTILIENVPTVQNSHSDVVATAMGLLRSSGYGVSMSVVRADSLGAPQRRARHFLIGVKGRQLYPDYLMNSAASFAAPAKSLAWAIHDLVDVSSSELIDTSPAMTPVNVARVEYLFEHDIHDLPDDQRPDCHKNGTTYTAVYGRMHWDRPAQTITTGFGTPGQGRYVHPIKHRLITPHEAARVQGFPDWFDFAPDGFAAKRKHLAKWIGDAVHPILGYTVAMAALSALAERDSLGHSIAATA